MGSFTREQFQTELMTVLNALAVLPTGRAEFTGDVFESVDGPIVPLVGGIEAITPKSAKHIYWETETRTHKAFVLKGVIFQEDSDKPDPEDDRGDCLE